MRQVPFNLPYTLPESATNVQHLVEDPELLNKRHFSIKCKAWFEAAYPDYHAFMTTSCTRALEIIALSEGIGPGHEVILPSFTYVGVANAFANYGARLVFVDLEPETMNVDIKSVEAAISKRTKAIVTTHYSGEACNTDKIKELCSRHDLIFIEDNAHGISTYHKEQLLGSFGDYSCISFDKLKNISTTEGGVLLCKKELSAKVEVAFENGTNRGAFLRGEVSSYGWKSHGSNFHMSEYNAAVLLPLLESSLNINRERRKIWNRYFDKISAIKELQYCLTPHLRNSDHNGHIFYLKFKNREHRNRVIKYMNSNGVACSFHYPALHLSDFGKTHSSEFMGQDHTITETEKLLRLPIYNDLTDDQTSYVVSMLASCVKQFP